MRVAVPSCDCLVGADNWREGATPPTHDPLSPLVGTCSQWDGDCEQCQKGVDRRCKPPSTICNQSCAFLSQPIQDTVRSGDSHQCFPWSWPASQPCPGPLCNATVVQNGTCGALPPPPPPPPTSPSANTTRLWLGTTDFRTATGIVHNLTAGVERCECVLTREFASGTKAYYNATSCECSGACTAFVRLAACSPRRPAQGRRLVPSSRPRRAVCCGPTTPRWTTREAAPRHRLSCQCPEARCSAGV